MEINDLRAIIIGGASGADVANELGGTSHPCNVLDFDGIELVIDEAVEALGGLDVALNTAGGGKGGRTISRNGPFSLDDFPATIDLDLVGTFNTNRLCAVHMAKNEPNADDERGVLNGDTIRLDGDQRFAPKQLDRSRELVSRSTA